MARAKIGFDVYQILKEKKLPQREIAALLAIKQPEVSHLMNGHFNRFTTDKLLDFLKRLERKVTIRISLHRPGEPYQAIGFPCEAMSHRAADEPTVEDLQRRLFKAGLFTGFWLSAGPRATAGSPAEKPEKSEKSEFWACTRPSGSSV